MNFRKKQSEFDNMLNDVAQEPEKPPFPSVVTQMPLVDQQRLQQYVDLAAELGFNNAQLVWARLLSFFPTTDWSIYDFDQMVAWLDDNVKEEGVKGWCWRPLREKDVVNLYWGESGDENTPESNYYGSGNSRCRVFTRLVPKSVLDKVKQIEAVFGDQVKFFVTHYDSKKTSSHFIMVRPAYLSEGLKEWFVFDYWEGNGFGM